MNEILKSIIKESEAANASEVFAQKRLELRKRLSENFSKLEWRIEVDFLVDRLVEKLAKSAVDAIAGLIPDLVGNTQNQKQAKDGLTIAARFAGQSLKKGAQDYIATWLPYLETTINERIAEIACKAMVLQACDQTKLLSEPKK